MNALQLFCGLLMLMVFMLSGLGVALHRLSASRERGSPVQAHACPHCSLALDPFWRHCPLCGQTTDQTSEQPRHSIGQQTAVTGSGHGG
jgi:hypothetical protein